MTPSVVRDVCLSLIAFLETGVASAGLLSEDIALDLTPPHWRLQARGVSGIGELLGQAHPRVCKVARWRALTTAEGFVMELELRWTDHAGDWQCREVIFASLRQSQVSQLTVYCTGAWDAARQQRHASEVDLFLPDLPEAGQQQAWLNPARLRMGSTEAAATVEDVVRTPARRTD